MIHWIDSKTPFTPIKSTFATVRHRTKECLNRKTGLAMAFKLMMSAQTKWRKLDGRNRLPEVVGGVEFRDGVRHHQAAARSSVTDFRPYLIGKRPLAIRPEIRPG